MDTNSDNKKIKLNFNIPSSKSKSYPDSDSSEIFNSSQNKVSSFEKSRRNNETLQSNSSTMVSAVTSLKKVTDPMLRKISPHGFVLKESGTQLDQPKINTKKEEKEKKKEMKKLEKWIKITQNWKKYSETRNYIKNCIRKGIPDALRGIVWYSVCKAESHKRNNPNLFNSYLKRELPKQIDKDIIKDLNRTFPEHIFFNDSSNGQKALYNVLKTIGLHLEDVGYCQGMGFIVATLLMYMGEENAFWVMVSIMDGKYNLRDMFKDGLPLVNERFFIFDNLIKTHIPVLYKHFKEQGFYPSLYANSWLITLFVNRTPFEITARVFDVFLNEGYKVIFRISLALLMSAKKELVKQDLGEMLETTKRLTYNFKEDPSELFKIAFKDIRLSRKTLDKISRLYILR